MIITIKRSLYHRFAIPFFVFITGGCVLTIEIAAIRILSPYYGNTIFTVSSVITIVLLALSLGYWAGGSLSDKHPEEKLFFSIIAASGAAALFLHLLGIFFLGGLGYRFSLMTGPVVSSAILFLVQSFLLGMLSPFAVKLQSVRLQGIGVGSAAGQIFFWSTVGSIAGSLLTGFVLIPNFGINKIMMGVSALLMMLGFMPLLRINSLKKMLAATSSLLLAVFFLYGAVAYIEKSIYETSGIIYSKDGLYTKIVIADIHYEGKPARILLQDRNVSAAMFPDSDELVFDYTKYYILYRVFNPRVSEALAIGAGAYSVPKALLADLPDVNVDVVEIEPSLFELSQKYFNLPDNPRLTTIVADGRRFLRDTDKRYDLIFSDAYSSLYSSPSHLITEEFFRMAKDRLADDGVFIANVIGSLSQEPRSLGLSAIKTFRKVFNNSYFFAVESPDSKGLQNMIFVGYNGKKKFDFGDPAFKEDGNPVISQLSGHEINLSKLDFSEQIVLTDDFSPVEYMIAKELKKVL